MDGRHEHKSSVPLPILVAVSALIVMVCSAVVLSNAVLPLVDQNSFLPAKSNFNIERFRALTEAKLREKMQRHNQSLLAYQESLKLLRTHVEPPHDNPVAKVPQSQNPTTSPPTSTEHLLLQKLLLQVPASSCVCSESTYVANTDFFGGDIRVSPIFHC